MIKFFRKIRQQLLNEGKTVRYLKYAIGEIILVMIGILLALQVNNWNELRKKNALEIKILNEIKVNLVSTMLSFNRTIETEEIYLKYNFIILDHINNNKPYDESLDEAFGMYFWTVTTPTVSAGYEYLKSTGLELIANDSLRIEISSIFENEIPVISSSNEVWANNLQQSISYPYHVENFVRYFSNLKNDD